MGRGRPKGSKNKVKDPERLEIKKDNTLLVNLFGNEKEVKKEIKKLKRLKLKCRSGSKERIKLYREIKKLKNSLDSKYQVNPKKIELIHIIEKLEPKISDIIDLRKFTSEQLQIHIDKVKLNKN